MFDLLSFIERGSGATEIMALCRDGVCFGLGRQGEVTLCDEYRLGERDTAAMRKESWLEGGVLLANLCQQKGCSPSKQAQQRYKCYSDVRGVHRNRLNSGVSTAAMWGWRALSQSVPAERVQSVETSSAAV